MYSISVGATFLFHYWIVTASCMKLDITIIVQRDLTSSQCHVFVLEKLEQRQGYHLERMLCLLALVLSCNFWVRAARLERASAICVLCVCVCVSTRTVSTRTCYGCVCM